MSYSVHYSFSHFSVFLAYFTSYSACFSISMIFLSCHNPGPTVCISILPFFCMFLAIFQVKECLFLNLHVFRCSCHIPCPTVCVSHFPWFSVFLSFSSPTVWISHFPPFFVFLSIFDFQKSLFNIFQDYQFSRHIPVPTVCISHFPRF